jgi:hypothetical protein
MDNPVAKALARRMVPFQEEGFQRDMQFAPGYRDWRIQFQRRFGEPPNLSPGGDYDYRLAHRTGVVPAPNAQGEYHWASKTPDGQWLKAPDHGTRWKETFMQAFGVDPDDATPEMLARAFNMGIR